MEKMEKILKSDKTIRQVALITASFMGNIDDCKRFLDADTNVNGTDYYNKTALHYAAGNGNLVICKLLVDAGAIIDFPHCPLMETALAMAAKHGHLFVCTFLLDAGAHVEPEVIMVALFRGHFNICDLLLNADSNLYTDIINTTRGPGGWSLLHHAVGLNNIEACQWLLQNGINVNSRDSNGRTALHCAIQNTGVNICILLLNSNIDLFVLSNEGETALDLAKRRHSITRKKDMIDIIQLLESAMNPLHA